jgi:hypothetical protein
MNALRSLRTIITVTMIAAALAACAAKRSHDVVLSTKSAVELRAMQVRVYDTKDKNKTLRTVIATLQDLGYSIDKVDAEAASVSANKLTVLRISASIYPHGTMQMAVRANAIVAQPGKDSQVDDPQFYLQRFFEPLSKAMFLTALQVEDVGDGPPVPLPVSPPPVEKKPDEKK